MKVQLAKEVNTLYFGHFWYIISGISLLPSYQGSHTVDFFLHNHSLLNASWTSLMKLEIPILTVPLMVSLVLMQLSILESL